MFVLTQVKATDWQILAHNTRFAEIKVEQYHYLTPSKKMSYSGFDLSRAFFMPNAQSYLTLGKTSSTFYAEYISAMIKPNISYLSSVL